MCPHLISTTLITFLAIQSIACGFMTRRAYVPAERIIPNIEKHIQENPNDASAYYTLGRIHYFRFINKTILVPDYEFDHTHPMYWRKSEGPESIEIIVSENAAYESLKEFGVVAPDEISVEKRRDFLSRFNSLKDTLREQGIKPQIEEVIVLQHAEEAVKHLQEAIRLDSKNDLFHLTLASLYQQYIEYKRSSAIELEPDTLKAITVAAAKEHFFISFRYSQAIEKKHIFNTVSGFGAFMSYESGNAYINLTPPDTERSKKDKRRIKKIRKHFNSLSKRDSFGSITPIIFTLTPHTHITDLLQPTLAVTFDLDGDGASEPWPWLKPDTALLVWDPDNTKSITSGRQLFGNATWWLLFTDGYRALDTLDNNRDGVLTHDELIGLSAWQDQNQDGISQSHEVTAVQELGITHISTQATSETQGMPMNQTGITLQNQTTIPTYDWITSPAKTPVTSPLKIHD